MLELDRCTVFRLIEKLSYITFTIGLMINTKSIIPGGTISLSLREGGDLERYFSRFLFLVSHEIISVTQFQSNNKFLCGMLFI